MAVSSAWNRCVASGQSHSGLDDGDSLFMAAALRGHAFMQGVGAALLITMRLQHQIRNRVNIALMLCFLIQPQGWESNLWNRSPPLLVDPDQQARVPSRSHSLSLFQDGSLFMENMWWGGRMFTSERWQPPQLPLQNLKLRLFWSIKMSMMKNCRQTRIT